MSDEPTARRKPYYTDASSPFPESTSSASMNEFEYLLERQHTDSSECCILFKLRGDDTRDVAIQLVNGAMVQKRLDRPASLRHRR